MVEQEVPDRARNKAYAAATTKLREVYRVEFDRYLAEEYEKAGLAARRRRTPEQIAEEAAAKEQVKQEKAEQKRIEKIAKLQAEIAALQDTLPVEDQAFETLQSA